MEGLGRVSRYKLKHLENDDDFHPDEFDSFPEPHRPFIAKNKAEAIITAAYQGIGDISFAGLPAPRSYSGIDPDHYVYVANRIDGERWRIACYSSESFIAMPKNWQAHNIGELRMSALDLAARFRGWQRTLSVKHEA